MIRVDGLLYIDGKPDYLSQFHSKDPVVQKRLRQLTKQRIDSFQKPRPILSLDTARRGKLGLPQEIIQRILEFICDEYEPTGIRLLPIVIEDLHNIALSSLDFCMAVRYSYHYLASKVRPLPGSDKRDWDEYIKDPMALKISDIKDALTDLKVYLPAGFNKPGTYLLPIDRLM
jgi:hypothetical protein